MSLIKEEIEVKDIEWVKERVTSRIKSAELNVMAHSEGLSEDFESRLIAYKSVMKLLNQLDKPEVLSQEWIDEHAFGDWNEYVYADDLKELLVPKQEDVDRAYKDGYEKGKQHTFYKGYLEGLTDKESEPETEEMEK